MFKNEEALGAGEGVAKRLSGDGRPYMLLATLVGGELRSDVRGEVIGELALDALKPFSEGTGGGICFDIGPTRRNTLDPRLLSKQLEQQFLLT